MEKTNIYVVRHGQTFWNAKRLFQGQSDIDLSPLGEEQARRLGNRIKDIHFDAVYTSDLKRTQQTARFALNNQQQQLKIEKDFGEMAFGIWEGKNIDDLVASEPEAMREFYENPREFKLEGLEPLNAFIHRVIGKFEEVIALNRGKRILIVAHGGVLNALKYQYIHRDINHFWKNEPYVKPTALAILSADADGIRFEQLPDASHCLELEAKALE